MYTSTERPPSPAAHSQPGTPLLPQRQRSSPVLGQSRGDIHAATAPTSAVVPLPLSGSPLWIRTALTSPTQHVLPDSFAAVPAPLLLARSAREATLHRVERGLSRTASNYAASEEDTDEGHRAASPVGLPELFGREASASWAAGGVRGGGPGTAASPSSSAPGTVGDLSVMSFESLWSNIDRYLFAVYTTLQTGDESSLRPLRAPKHRMGWYTVIYNACSGDPAKSRELYARLALLLLHVLESHVLFPILQNIDHSRIEFLTGAEGDAAAEEGALGLSGSTGNAPPTATATPAAVSSSNGGGGGGGSSSGWGRFRSIATNGAGGRLSSRSKDSSRNSSFQGSLGGSAYHPPSQHTTQNHATASVSNASNSSFGFMRRLFQTAGPRATSPVVNMDNDDMGDEGSIVDSGRQTSSPGLPRTPVAATTTAATAAATGGYPQQLQRGRIGWSSTSYPTTPLQQPYRSGSGPAAAVSCKLHSAFEGFDSTVRRWDSKGTPTISPLPPRASPPPAAAAAASTAASARSALTIQTDTSLTTPNNGPMTRSPPAPGVTAPSSVPHAALSLQSTLQTVAHTTSGSGSTASQSPDSGPFTATPSSIAAHHVRVASKTGRVLLGDEDEVLCEANTVASELRQSRRQQQRWSYTKHHHNVDAGRTTRATNCAVQQLENTPPPPARSVDASMQRPPMCDLQHPQRVCGDTNTSDDDGDDSLHTMNSSLSSHRGSPANDRGGEEEEDTNAPTSGSGTAIRRDRLRVSVGPRCGGATSHQRTVTGNFIDNPDESTAVPSADLVSPSSSSLASAADMDSPLLPMNPPGASYLGVGSGVTSDCRDEKKDAAAAPTNTSAAGESARRLPRVLHSEKNTTATGTGSGSPGRRGGPGEDDSRSAAAWLSRQTSSREPISFLTGRETAAPMSRGATTRHAISSHESTLYDGAGSGNSGPAGSGGNCCSGETTAAATDHVGWRVHSARRFSLCYTFVQEWQTFLAFRGVVLSCFRYLDQYYTRRYGMDTITLMCFKVFYVAVYEPLRPLLLLELRYLTRYVREVFETTGQIAWEQLELIQTTYSIMAELLVLVRSTSSYMVAQQQQQQQKASGGVANATVTNTTAAVAVVSPSLTAMEAPRSRASSQSRALSGGRSGIGGGGGGDSGASSVVGTPRVGSLDPNASGAVPSFLGKVEWGGATAAAAAAAPPTRRHRLLSLFSGKRRDSSSSSGQAGATPASSRAEGRLTSPADGAKLSSSPLLPVSRRGSPALPSSSDPGGPVGLSVHEDVLDVDSVEHSVGDGGGMSAGGGDGTSASPSFPLAPLPSVPTVVVDLRGTVELRNRLEGHTTAHHLTTQALKQWEGLAADRRLRNGTIVKETAKPLAAIVMEDLGNDYVAGIYGFYRSASAAHRETEEGRRAYVEWAAGAKALEGHVWRRVRLPFLHVALRSALNEALVLEHHHSILLDRQFGLRALLEAWSASLVADDLALAPQVPTRAATLPAATAAAHGATRPAYGGADSRTAGSHASPIAAPLLRSSSSPQPALSKAASEFVEAPIHVGLLSADQHFASAFPHRTRHQNACAHSLNKTSRGISTQSSPSAAWGDDGVSTASKTTRQRESSWRWDRASGASVVIQSATAAAATAAGAALSALGRTGSERVVERISAWVGVGDSVVNAPVPAALTSSSTPATSRGTSVSATVGQDSPGDARDAGKSVTVSAASCISLSAQQGTHTTAVNAPAAAASPPQPSVVGVVVPASATATAALRDFYALLSDVTEDECFVLMAAVLITKFICDAADLFQTYIAKVHVTESPAVEIAAAAAIAAGPTEASAGVALMTALVGLVDAYTALVSTVFHDHPILHRALCDAVEEVMCPTRWTKKGSLQAAQLRAQEMAMAAAAAAAATNAAAPATVNEDAAVEANSGLPSVLLSRDARHAMLPLASLATHHPLAVQQMRLSILLARYADAFLLQERVGGRVVSGSIHARLRLIGRLVSLLEDKDTFLEHYRLCLARRLLGTSAAAAPPSGDGAPSSVAAAASFTTLNIEAERQLVGCLQSYLGASGTHAFEAMLRDYEGTQRTRELFEQEPAFERLSAKIRVQLITSAQWPMYTTLPLTPHLSLRSGMDAFRGYYARLHPSRTLLWVFSLGTATLTAEVVSGSKQVVASTLLATLLLVVSDAANARGGAAGSITGEEIAQQVGMPFQALRTHLHLLSQHRAFNLLRWLPSTANAGARASPSPPSASMSEADSFTLNPHYTHKLRKIRLPLPKTRLTGLPSGEATAAAEGSATSTQHGGTCDGSWAAGPPESVDAVVSRHVSASRRLLLDTALVRVFKSRRVASFDDLVHAVTAQLSFHFVPTRRDVKTQLEGLIDREYVRRSSEDANTFVYVS